MQVDIQEGKTLYLEMLGVGHVTPAGERKVSFKLNGESRYVMVTDAAEATAGGGGGMEKADPLNDGHVGAPMPGSVVKVDVEPGQRVEAGQPLVTLSAMKMETVVSAATSGVVKRVAVTVGDNLVAGDLLVEVEDDEDEEEEE